MGQQGGIAGMMLPLAMFAVIFYFMIIRPQKKRQKAHDDMLASISRGDTVVTAGGFFGVVREILDDSYLLELDEGVKARILKSSISMKRSEGSLVSPQQKKKKSKRNDAPQQEKQETQQAPEEAPAEIPTRQTQEETARDVAFDASRNDKPEERTKEA